MKLYHAVMAGLIACGLVIAQEAAATAPAPAAEKAAPAKKAASVKVEGTVVSTDAAANTVTIKTKKADEVVSVTEKTKITVGGKKATLAELTAEMKVTASCKKEEDKLVAKSISEKAAAKKAAKAKAEKTEAAPAAAPAEAPAAAPAAAPAGN